MWLAELEDACGGGKGEGEGGGGGDARGVVVLAVAGRVWSTVSLSGAG